MLSSSAKRASYQVQHKARHRVSSTRKARHRRPSLELDTEGLGGLLELDIGGLLSTSAGTASSCARRRAPPLGLGKESLPASSPARYRPPLIRDSAQGGTSSRAQKRETPLRLETKMLPLGFGKGPSLRDLQGRPRLVLGKEGLISGSVKRAFSQAPHRQPLIRESAQAGASSRAQQRGAPLGLGMGALLPGSAQRAPSRSLQRGLLLRLDAYIGPVLRLDKDGLLSGSAHRWSTWGSTRLGLTWLRLGKRLSFVRGRLYSKLCSSRISSDLGSVLVACLET